MQQNDDNKKCSNMDELTKVNVDKTVLICDWCKKTIDLDTELCGSKWDNVCYSCYNDDEQINVDEYLLNPDFVPDTLPKQSQPSYHEIICISEISKCHHLPELVKIMNNYKINNDVNNIDITKTLDNFLHLIHAHNDDEQFEMIVNQFVQCEITDCEMFRRNNRNRCTQNQQFYTNNVITDQIFDKIHCYFMHCYDIGNKLSSKDKDIINDTNNEEIKINDDDELLAQCFINCKLRKMKEILISKRQQNKNIIDITDKRISTKYNALFSNHNIQKNDDKLDSNEDRTYKFGYDFEYGYEGECYPGYSTKISPKFASLKEELITNLIARISIEQFNNEYNKAQIHYNSKYCKESFVQHIEFTDKRNITGVGWIFLVEYALSLMIYCNYTELQYQFSKTYRDNFGLQHDNFYHLGKNLKICVKKFGTKMHEGNVSQFYHGIGEQLVFPQYIACAEDNSTGINGVEIYGPLSTSSSYTVAANFTNFNKGLIVEFGNPYHYFSESGSSPKYFNMSWLSDFGNESEYFFIQNLEDFAIINVTDAHTGIEFDVVIKAMKMLHEVISSRECTIMDMDISNNIKQLIVRIIHHQLSSSLSLYSRFNSLHEYAKIIIKTYCEKRRDMFLHFDLLQDETYSYILEIFYDVKNEWIRFDEIHALFANIQNIFVRNIKLTDSIMMDNVFNYMKDQNQKSKTKWITIVSNDCSELTVALAKSKYNTQFEAIECNMELIGDELQELSIQHKDHRPYTFKYNNFNIIKQ